ncbi:hypothetical protein L596_009837 [Steinernema carpocapsae]|uniref:Uncharacterized protein n=1 Tax=Steinernema carpocapsae TaxID=34508 RepID=A0A4V6A6Q3_STECR|nr:hypothetical protein L596_009837 [Steinernema carpocapsae]
MEPEDMEMPPPPKIDKEPLTIETGVLISESPDLIVDDDSDPRLSSTSTEDSVADEEKKFAPWTTVSLRLTRRP